MTRDFNLKLLLMAFVIALAIKFSVQVSEHLSNRVIEAQVTYSTPSADYIAYDLVDKVKVNVRGPNDEISQLTQFNIEIVADVPVDELGPTTIVLEENNVRFNRNWDVDVLGIDPKSFTIQVERKLQKTLPIIVELTGEPAAGARHGEPVVRPREAQVSGPESRVDDLLSLTAQVSLAGHARTFEDTVTISSPDPLVQVARPALATVRVPMEEPELNISFDELAEDEG